MTAIVTAFNNIGTQFMAELVETFPDEPQFKVFKSGVRALIWANKSKLIQLYAHYCDNFHDQITTKDDVKNEGAKEYHRQVLDLAKDAIDEQSLNEYEFQSFTMAIPKEKISLAKEMIRKFRSKLSKAVSSNGDNVYQTSIQFFQLTKSPKNSYFEDKDVVRDTSNNKQGEKYAN